MQSDTAMPVEHSTLFSEEGRARKMAHLRILVTKFAGKEGVIGLHGGIPPATAFPIAEMSLKLRDGTRIVIDDPAKARIWLLCSCLTVKSVQRLVLTLCLKAVHLV